MMPSSIVKDNMFPLALMGVLALGGLCTIDPSSSPPSPLQDIFKYGGFRNSCLIFVLVFSRLISFSPDDCKILEKCCQKNLFLEKNMMWDMKESNQKEKESSKQSEFQPGQSCSEVKILTTFLPLYSQYHIAI